MPRTIVIDFDGVLHSYTSGWQGSVPTDLPTAGAQNFMRDLIDAGWEPIIQTTRAATPEGLTGTLDWLERHEFPPDLEVTHVKPPALVYLDDRALRFDGEWPTADVIDAAAKPWNK